MRQNIYLTDDLAERVKQSGISVSPICQRALEVAARNAIAGMEHIELLCGDRKNRTWKEAFNGRWLVPPGTESEEKRPDHRYGVAITAKGIFVIYVTSPNDSFPPGYYTYSSLGEAFHVYDENFEPWQDDAEEWQQWSWPWDILLSAADELGTELVVELDI